MSTSSLSTPGRTNKTKFWLIAVGLLCVVLLVLFHPSFESGKVVFANDGPLGVLVSAAAAMPGVLLAYWKDLNWLGTQELGAALGPTTGIYVLLTYPFSVITFAKFYVPASLLFLGICAVICGRRMGFHPVACILLGIAAALNTNVLSNAAWGLPTRALNLGVAFLAIAALHTGLRRNPWLCAILAGLAVGFGIMEGFDVGAIFSLYLAAFAFFLALQEPGGTPQRIFRGLSRVAIMAICAALISFQAMTALVETQLKGVAQAKQTQMGGMGDWNWATQWSLPKIESLRILIAGLFGYRLDTPDGGNYWGTVGRDPVLDANPELIQQGQHQLRHSGSGEYAGVLVVMVAIWAFAQACRGQASPYSARDRRLVLFWAAMAFVSLLLAFGRHAPFYQLIFPLPFFSSIRNPIKFLHPFHLTLLVLFGYGLHDLCQRFSAKASAGNAGLQGGIKAWWGRTSKFEKKWVMAAALVGAISVIGWLAYSASRGDLIRYLTNNGFPETIAAEISAFSIKEVRWYVIFFALSLGAVVLLLSRPWSGIKSQWVMIALGGVLTADLLRASTPWVLYYDYQYKYQSNPVIDILRDKPYERRVALLPFWPRDQQFELFQQLYGIEWTQHLYQYYNIQSLDIVQAPRAAIENAIYKSNFQTTNMASIVRLWELTNTRYLIGLAGFVEVLNQQLDPKERRFRVHTTFDLAAKGGQSTNLRLEDLTAVIKPDGPYAIIEFTGALPRAATFEHWQVNTNDQEVLKILVDPEFDPKSTVLVSGDVAELKTASASTNHARLKKAEFVHYSPKNIQLKTEESQASVLLLNDKHHPDWKVWVDGKPQPLLRCNYIMRGVFLAPGAHLVNFRFQPSLVPFYISLATLLAGAAVLAYLIVIHKDNGGLPQPQPAETKSTQPAP